MYDFVDRPVTALCKGGRFLIWSMRSWTVALGGQVCPASTIAPAFAKWRMIGGLQPFHRTMLLLNRDALEVMQIAPLDCGLVSEDEALLLALVRSASRAEDLATRKTLDMLVDSQATGDLMSSLGSLCQSLAKAGLIPRTPAMRES